jgi:hypothetical protein
MGRGEVVSRRDYETVCMRLAASEARVAELTAEVGRLADLVARGNDRITELLAIAQRNKGSTRASTDKTPEPPPSLDDDAKKAFAERPAPPKLPKKKKRAKKKTKPTGRKPLPDNLEADKHTTTPDACRHCGGTDLEIVDEVVEVKLHAVKAHIRKREVRRKTCCCRDCGERTTARSLPAPFARSKATCEWLAWLVHQKFVMLAPLDRIRRDLASRGIKLAMSYLVTQIERAADLLGAVDGEHWKQLLAGSWMATDATGLKVLIPKLPGTHNGHLEVYRRDDLVVFQYEPHKGGEVLTKKLAPFSGLLVADAEHRHNAVFADGRVVEAGCNAHGRRKLRDAESVQPALAKEGGAFISAMYLAEAEAQKQGLTGDKLRWWRQKKIPPLADQLKAWMDAVEPTLTPTDPLAETIRYYRNHWEALFRFVDYPEIPIDNSASEREYQQVAKIRLNCLFAGSTEGAHRAATLLGIVATCRAIGVDPLGYLGWAFTHLGTHRDVYGLSAAEVTPAAYAKAHPVA